jgi:hypothetical protein
MNRYLGGGLLCLWIFFAYALARYANSDDGSIIGEWLVNYADGFTRRGWGALAFMATLSHELFVFFLPWFWIVSGAVGGSRESRWTVAAIVACGLAVYSGGWWFSHHGGHFGFGILERLGLV